MSASHDRRSKRPSLELALVAALTLFAILCGGVLLLAQTTSTTAATTAAPAAPTRVIVEALGELERASQALDAADYGVARTRVQRARASLTELLPQRSASR